MTVDPASQVPPTDLLPWRTKRAIPYLYSHDEIAALLAATDMLSTPLRSHDLEGHRRLPGDNDDLVVLWQRRDDEALIAYIGPLLR